MSRIYPVTFKWLEADVVDADGVVRTVPVMVPHPRFAKICERQFHDAEEYTLVPLEPRSRASHNHFFAAISEGFKNMPASMDARWPSAEHMRKWILVETGWFDEKEFECPDEDFAKKLGTFVRTEDEFARISVHRPSGNHDSWKVIIRRAMSQSAAAMGKRDFEASKKDVLDLLEHFLTVPRGTLMKEAGRNAT